MNINKRRWQKLAGIKENQKHSYLEKEGDDVFINYEKALQYLKQFDDDEISAEVFMGDEEGWGDFQDNIENLENMNDIEIENALKQAMSFYFFSDGDSI